ncbi:MAG: SPFH domain-containing protein [Patescibacteria group bacterium]
MFDQFIHVAMERMVWILAGLVFSAISWKFRSQLARGAMSTAKWTGRQIKKWGGKSIIFYRAAGTKVGRGIASASKWTGRRLKNAFQNQGSATNSAPEASDQSNPKMDLVRLNRPLYRKINTAMLFALIGISFGVYLTWFTILGTIGSLNFNLGFWFIFFPLLYVAFSIRVVKPNELASFYFYDIALKNTGAGPHFVPPGILTLKRGPRDLQEFYMPGPPDIIDWNDEKIPAPKGMVKPVFINTSFTVDNGSSQAQMSVGVIWFVFWRIVDLATFIANVGTIAEARSQLEKMSLAVLNEDFASKDYNGIISGLAQLNEHLDDHIRARTLNWGIQVIDADVTKINPSHEYAKAQRDAAMAPFLATAKVTAAKADADAIVVVGEAKGKALRAEAAGPLRGRAEGMKEMMEAISVDGSEVLAAETARATIPGANATILGDGGLMQAASIGKLFGLGLKTEGATEKPEPVGEKR